MNPQQLWQSALGELELSLSKANFTTWFKNTGISSLEGEKVVISVPNGFTKEWLEKKYHTNILKALRSVSDNKIKFIEYKIEAVNQQKPLNNQLLAIKEDIDININQNNDNQNNQTSSLNTNNNLKACQGF